MKTLIHNRFLWRMLLIPALFLRPHPLPGAGSLPGNFFADRPDHSLVRQLETGLQPSRTTSGLSLVRRARWAPALGALVVETDLVNPGSRALGLEEVPVVDLAFRSAAQGMRLPFEELVHRDEMWYGSTFWSGPDWTRVGRDWHHPGENTPSVRSFRAPRDGRVTVSGRVRKLHLDGDGVRVAIRHEGREVWGAEIEGRDDRGVDPGLELELRRGETVRFIVHKRGTIFCDTTGWDPVVTYADGQTFRASDSFSALAQGAGGWRYEMLREERAVSWPVLLSLETSGLLHQGTIEPAQRVDREAGSTLPLFVVADPASQSGVILAWDSKGPWSFRAGWNVEGRLRLTVKARPGEPGAHLPPGAAVRLPAFLLKAYDGPWMASFTPLRELIGGIAPGTPGSVLAGCLEATLDGPMNGLQSRPELDLFLMLQVDWSRDDNLGGGEGFPQVCARAASNHLERAARVLADLRQGRHPDFLDREAARWRQLAAEAARPDRDPASWPELYLQTRLLKREIMLLNPLLDFRELLFCKRRSPGYSHLVGQYYGWRQRPGGGLFALQRPGYSLRTRDLLDGQLPAGSCLEPCLSWDGRRVVFSHVACPDQPLDCRLIPVNESGPDEAYFHLYEIGTDGTGLRQLTWGRYDDLMPACLPDGGIAFCSTRRRTYSRCFHVQFSHRWHCYTLYRLDGIGGEPRPLSANDVNEWFPSVSRQGDLLFARWDYVDRDAVTHQNLWAMAPDGTNLRAVWGNATPRPHCTFQAKPIPDSDKIVFIASAHHALTAGPICLLDPAADSNSRLDAITRLTPGPFPEAESMQIPDYYQSPWPLSENCFLAAYSRERLRFEGEHMHDPNPDHALGIYLLDAAGNRELIYRDPLLSSTSPIPLLPRPQPPILASSLHPSAPPSGELILADIYQGLEDVPRGAIRQLRIIEIFPKTTRDANSPRIGFAGEENARAILGTVRVEPDGSARFRVPALRPLLFQALDQDGVAYQTMRSTTTVQPGETLGCIGCHENRMRAVPPRRLLALNRAPSVIEPGPFEAEPFSFMRVVQPVLDRHCVPCHGGEKTESGLDLTAAVQDGFARSYWTLCGRPGDFDGPKTNPENAAASLVPRFGQRNSIEVTPPGGLYGARGSRLLRLLRAGHEEVQLSEAEFRRLAAWIDCNAIFYGTYDPAEQARQLAGHQIAMPDHLRVPTE